MKKILCVLVGLFLVVTAPASAELAKEPVDNEQFKVLVFTKTAGWHHKSQLEGVAAMRKMAKKHHFLMEWHEDATRINTENLKQFDVIIFLNTTADILNDEQQDAMETFIQEGKGFVGIHSASDTEYEWPWYQKLIGRHFVIHPIIQTAELSVINRNFPGLSTLPDKQLWTDEWYEFGDEAVDDLTYLLTIDEDSFDPNVNWGDGRVGDGMGAFHPVAWHHEFDGGRSFYTALGHVAANYEDPMFLAHVYGGIYWAATGKGVSD